ncbi:MAG: hypothetical protein QOH80_74 [Actinomycetota bacterium]|nr:hypothetical protein [Actinomycetota bacterium]
MTATAVLIAPGRTPGGATGGHLRVVLGAGVAVAVAVVAVLNRAAIGSGGATLAAADLEWLVFALALVVAVFLAGTAAQLGAMPIRPPVRQLFAVQVAASVANQVVPAGVGGMAVNVRYLQRAGMTRSAAVAAVGLSSVATFVTHLALVAALWAVAPASLRRGSLSSLVGPGGPGGVVQQVLPGSSVLAEGAVAVALVVTVAAVLAGASRRRLAWHRLRTAPARGWGHIRRELRDTGQVLRQPGRAALLWVGSAASPALHALILVAVYKSLAGSAAGLVVALAYLVVSSVAALVPAPGALGAFDVALVAVLVAVGTPTTTALAAVLGYRLITVWLPLVPSALVFAALLRRRVL